MPKLRYFALSIVTVVLVQSSPFLTGFGNLAMILFLAFFSWAVSAAIVASSAVTIWFAGQSGVRLGVTRLAVLVGALAIAYQLPFIELSGFTALLLAPAFGVSVSELWDANWAPIATASGEIWLLALTAAAAFVLTLDGTARRCGHYGSDPAPQVVLPIVFVVTSVMTLHLAFTVLLRWEYETPVPIVDTLTEWAYPNRAVLPIVTLAGPLLVLGAYELRRSVRRLRGAK
jgi:hypothetical protein